MSKKTCEACGSMRKDRDLLPYAIIPEEVTECSEITVLHIVILCANCRTEIADWDQHKVHRVHREEKSQLFIPLSAEELAKEYESAYSAFHAHKRLIRMVEKYSKTKITA